jgi:Uma2 family endonuclease
MSSAPKHGPRSAPGADTPQRDVHQALRSRPKSKAASSRASFRFGYREIQVKRSNGRIEFERIPLTLEDVLHPQFGDVHVLSDAHGDDCLYLRDVLKARYQDDPSVVVFYDVGIFWDIPGLKHHSPDVSLIFGVKKRKEWKSFHVKTEKVRPDLIVEVTPPDTRVNDVKTKVEQYATAKVPHYVVVDAAEKEGRRRLMLTSYRLVDGHYVRQEPDEHGRVWLEPAGLWLGVRIEPQTGGDRVALFDGATGQEIGDYTALSRARAESETRADQAETRAEAEAASRAAAEERIRQLEAELRRLRGAR